MFYFWIYLICAFTYEASATITGWTYRDDMDFASRYRDRTECDPMHWYPLHMPDYCVQRLQKLMDPKLQELPYPPTIQLKFESEPTRQKHVKESPSSYMMSLLRSGHKPPRMSMSGSNYGPVILFRPEVSEKAARQIMDFTGLGREMEQQRSRKRPRSRKRRRSRRREYLRKILKDVKKDDTMVVQVD